MAIKTLNWKADKLPELGNPVIIPLTDDQLNNLASTYGGTDATFEDRLGTAAKNQFVQTWTGCVVALRERNMHDDSDFYATVWDAEADQPREIMYATTRGWSYWNSAVIDADEQVQAEYKSWKIEQATKARAERAAEEAAIPREGKTVEVTGGRKLPKGTTCTAFWYGKDKIRSNRWNTYYRVGVKLADGTKVFLDADHVKVV